MRRALACTLLAASLFIGTAEAKTFVIKSDENAEILAQMAFANARSGDFIRFDDGRIELTKPLRINASGIDIRGAGAEKTVISFRGMPGEGAGLIVNGDHNRLYGLTVVEAKGAAIVVSGSNILVQEISVHGAKGPGVLVTRADTAIVERSSASGAASGFTVQNASHVDIQQNSSSGNGVGMQIIDLPDASAGGSVRILKNTITANNGQGIGIDVVAVRDVAIFENTIGEHGTANIFVRGYDGDSGNAAYVALPRNITIGKNKFGRAGFSPSPTWAPATAAGARFTDIVWDGARSYFSGGRPQSAPVLFEIQNNNTSSMTGTARFLSLGLEVVGSPASEASPSTQWPLRATFPVPGPARIK